MHENLNKPGGNKLQVLELFIHVVSFNEVKVKCCFKVIICGRTMMNVRFNIYKMRFGKHYDISFRKKQLSDGIYISSIFISG